MINGTRYSTLGAWSHWLADSSAAAAAMAHHVHRAEPSERVRATRTDRSAEMSQPPPPPSPSPAPVSPAAASSGDSGPGGGPQRLKHLRPAEVAALIERDPRLILPVGTCEQHGPHMPLGADTIIVERLSSDLSAEFGILLAPTVEYGVNVVTERGFAGNASLRKKTLHRMLNDLLDTWESTGIREFILLTAHEHDPHLEALSTVITSTARVRVIDIFGVNFIDLLEGQGEPMHGDEVDTSLMLHLAPELVDMSLAQDYMMSRDELRRYRRGWLRVPRQSPGSIGRPTLATAEKGRALYERIHKRIRDRVFIAPPG
jgi:creatinine amidohydrolase